MKLPFKLLVRSAVVFALPILASSCVGPAEATGGVVYGDGPWFQDNVWLDGGGRGWYGGHGGAAYVHPGAGGHGPGGGSRGGGRSGGAAGGSGDHHR